MQLSKKNPATDYLVVGAGIAGLCFALEVAKKAPKSRILIIVKQSLEESNTKYAQGGIAAVVDKDADDIERHISDTLKAGAGLCNKKVVQMVIREAPRRVQELIELGVQFDRSSQNSFHLGLEGGHSQARILHHKDRTGHHILKALIRQVRSHKNIHILTNCIALDLIVVEKPGRAYCGGVHALDLKQQQLLQITATQTLMATGGSGNVFNSTTNSVVASGDGVAMAYRAGLDLKNMEFIQFHPTSFYNPNKDGQAFLITEALRGAGARLMNHKGEMFADKFDKRGSLAPRDVVARAIDHELATNATDHVLLDCTSIDKTRFQKEFPGVYQHCIKNGIDPCKQAIPVVPAAHYQCGGIVTDINGKTSLQNLFACGEVAYTGMHGANRLASNSLLEALVFAYRAAMCSLGLPEPAVHSNIPHTRIHYRLASNRVNIRAYTKEVKELMSSCLGITRSTTKLQKARKRLNQIHRIIERMITKDGFDALSWELYNLETVARQITHSAIGRDNNIGLHMNVEIADPCS